MAHLGAVLGGVLAELTRARVVSDQLTKELLAEYEGDPVLGAMSVPRVTIGGAELVVRFTVADFEEAPVHQPTPGATRDAWQAHAESVVLPALLRRRGLSAEAVASVTTTIAETAPALAGRPAVAEIRAAMGGDAAAAAKSTSEPLLDGWSRLPRAIREEIGSKAVFRKEVNADLATELSSFLERQTVTEQLRAVLASRIDVAVTSSDLAGEDPGRVQELRLTLSSDDLDMVLQEAEGVI
jgi:hypothetical protein